MGCFKLTYHEELPGIFSFHRKNATSEMFVQHNSSLKRNHLGNVLSIISDKVIPHANGTTVDYYLADIRQSSDYSPFGVQLSGRNFVKSGAKEGRFGFNGMEEDDELKGEGNSYDFGARMLDPRLGRFFVIDPMIKSFAHFSSYQYASNSPIMFSDENGEYPIVRITKKKVGSVAQRIIGFTGVKTQYTRVSLYKVIVTDTEDKKFKMVFSVTRDAFAVKKEDNDGETMTLTNVAFEPKDGDINHFTAVPINGGYPEGNGTTAFKLTQYGSEVVHAEGNQDAVELGYRSDPEVASGVMIHVGGYYQKSDGSIKCAASEGCFGVAEGRNSENSYLSNSYNNKYLDAIVKKANESTSNKGKIEVIIEKRSKNERVLKKKQKIQ